MAPLVEDEFSRSRSPIEAMHYAALGVSMVVSEVPAYRSIVRHNETGLLVANDPDRRQALRASFSTQARGTGSRIDRATLFAEHTVAAITYVWLDALSAGLDQAEGSARQLGVDG